jgi:hypothetical protein
MVGRESKRPLGPMFLTEVKFRCQRLGRPKRTCTVPFKLQGVHLVSSKGQRLPASPFTLLRLPLVGVYFRYFLDPDQGQTGPVSWEFAPLPPPRPVLTLKLFFRNLCSMPSPVRPEVADLRPFAGRQHAKFGEGALLPSGWACVSGRQNRRAQQYRWPGDELHSGQKRPGPPER